MQQKVATWIDELERLSSIAITQPHAAFAAFTHGLTSRLTYLARTTPNIEELSKPLEETIRKDFLPNLTGRNAFNDTERDLLELPALALVGLAFLIQVKRVHYTTLTCETIIAPLVCLILDQTGAYAPEVKADQTRRRKNARKFHRQLEARTANDLKETLPTKLQKALTIRSEKGASSWLSALPITEHGFALHKGAFRDVLCLRYMGGDHHIYPPTVSVASTLPLNMPLAAQEADFLLFATTKSATLPPT